MNQILKRFLTRSPSGRPLAIQTERLTDDGHGRTHITTERAAGWCAGCRRPITDLTELRGRCDFCRVRGCCVHCATSCQVCARRLCGNCRRGFPGPPPMTVCPICQARLRQRQAIQDRLLFQRAALERHMMVQRERERLRGMQLAAERLRWSARLQQARLNTQRQLAIMRHAAQVRLELARLATYERRALR